MAFGMSLQERTLTVIHLDHLTGEYVGEGQVLIPPMTGLPAHCTQVESPRDKKNFARVFNEAIGRWRYIEDHRGRTVYDKKTGFTHVISDIGKLPDNMTLAKPDSPYSKWSGSAWIEDEEAALQAMQQGNKNKKDVLLDTAMRLMVPLQNAVKLNMATSDEQRQLTEWEKYTVLLNRVDLNHPQWPVPPYVA